MPLEDCPLILVQRTWCNLENKNLVNNMHVYPIIATKSDTQRKITNSIYTSWKLVMWLCHHDSNTKIKICIKNKNKINNYYKKKAIKKNIKNLTTVFPQFSLSLKDFVYNMSTKVSPVMTFDILHCLKFWIL